MSWQIGTSLVRRNLQSVNKERMPVLQHNVNDLIDAREVYFNFGAFHRKAFIVINFSPIATKLIRFQLKYQGSLSKEQHPVHQFQISTSMLTLNKMQCANPC